MRILHALHSYHPESHGGIESYVSGLAAVQRRRGHEVTVLCSSDVAAESEEIAIARFEMEGVSVMRIPAPTREPYPLDGSDARQASMVRDALGAVRPEVVHIHHWHNLTTGLAAAAKSAGARVAVTIHDYFSTCPLFFRVPDDKNVCGPEVTARQCAECVERFLPWPVDALHAAIETRAQKFRDELTSADVLLALSESQRRSLAALEITAGMNINVLPFPSSISPGEAKPATRPARAANSLRLISWGGLVPGKGMGVAVDACERSRHAENIMLVHYGRVLDDGFREDLQRSARRIKLELRGTYDRSDLLKQFAEFDCALFLSLFPETHSVSVDEAMAIGLPLIVSDRGAPKDRVGARGHVVPAGDSIACARLLDQMIDDPRILVSMAAAPAPPMTSYDEHWEALEAHYLVRP